MENPFLRMIGRRVREFRKQDNLSQEELAEKAGFHSSYIGGLERGEKNITLLNLQKVADALNVQIYELFVISKNYQRGKSERDRLINELILKITSLKALDIRKLMLFIDEFIENK